MSRERSIGKIGLVIAIAFGNATSSDSSNNIRAEIGLANDPHPTLVIDPSNPCFGGQLEQELEFSEGEITGPELKNDFYDVSLGIGEYNYRVNGVREKRLEVSDVERWVSADYIEEDFQMSGIRQMRTEYMWVGEPEESTIRQQVDGLEFCVDTAGNVFVKEK